MQDLRLLLVHDRPRVLLCFAVATGELLAGVVLSCSLLLFDSFSFAFDTLPHALCMKFS